MELQLRLNRCVGQTAQGLQKKLNQIESDNKQIKHFRYLIALAQLTPELLPPLRASLLFFVTRQNSVLMQWKVQQMQWLFLQGCEARGDRAAPLPSLSWVRPLADSLGEQELRRSETSAAVLKIQLHHAPRGMAAQVYSRSTDAQDLYSDINIKATHEVEEEVENVFSQSIWKMRWCPEKERSGSVTP